MKARKKSKKPKTFVGTDFEGESAHDKRRCERRKSGCSCWCPFCVRFHDD